MFYHTVTSERADPTTKFFEDLGPKIATVRADLMNAMKLDSAFKGLSFQYLSHRSQSLTQNWAAKPNHDAWIINNRTLLAHYLEVRDSYNSANKITTTWIQTITP